MLEVKRLADGSTLLQGDRGAVRLSFSGTGACIATCYGIQMGEMAPHVIAAGQEMLAKHGRCVFFPDSYDSPRMDTEFREQMTRWIIPNRRAVRTHLLQRSKLIEMAVNVANLFAGGTIVHAYTSIREWELEVQKEFGPSYRRQALSAADLLPARTPPAR